MSAAELLEMVATRFWQAMETALPWLPPDLRAALAWRVEDSDMRWALSLMLGAWRLTDPREPKAGDMSQLVKQLGATWVLGQINHLRGLDGFQLFVDRARDATSDAKRKAAAVALNTAIERLDRMQLTLLVELLRRSEVRDIGKVLIRRFPTPGSTRPPVWGTPPAAPKRDTSIGAMFDRADYAPRERALKRPREIPLGNLVADETPTPKRPISSPTLDDHAVTVAFLHTLGYSEADIARLMAGPSGKAS